MTDNPSVLDIPMSDNDADAETVGGYLQALLLRLWRAGEDFNSKRPFGNSGWQFEVYAALVVHGAVNGSITDDGELDEVDDRAADDLIAAAITELTQH